MTKYGYARVSTASQSTKEQLRQLLENGVEKKNIFSEKFTDTKRDRFARNTIEVLEIIEPLLDNNITIKVLNLGTIENTLMGRMVTLTLLSLAEMECDMIVERTQEGKLFAKKNNPNFKERYPKAIITPKKRHAYELITSGKSYKEV